MSFLKFCMTSPSGYYAAIHCDFIAFYPGKHQTHSIFKRLSLALAGASHRSSQIPFLGPLTFCSSQLRRSTSLRVLPLGHWALFGQTVQEQKVLGSLHSSGAFWSSLLTGSGVRNSSSRASEWNALCSSIWPAELPQVQAEAGTSPELTSCLASFPLLSWLPHPCRLLLRTLPQ